MIMTKLKTLISTVGKYLLIACGSVTGASSRVEEAKSSDLDLKIPHKSVATFVKKVSSKEARNTSHI